MNSTVFPKSKAQLNRKKYAARAQVRRQRALLRDLW